MFISWCARHPKKMYPLLSLKRAQKVLLLFILGLSFGKLERKMGWNSSPTSTVSFEDVRVPQSNMIGKPGDGFKIAMKALDGGRINIGSCSLGGAAYSFERSKSYLQERK